jgi:two-component system NarL family sensor kinase
MSGSVQRAVLQFALSALGAVVLLGIVGVELLQRTGTDEAIRDAKEQTALAGRGIVGPNVTAHVLSGDPAAIARLDRIVRTRVLNDRLIRLKLWTPDGRVVYSDEPRLIGARYELDPDDLDSFRSGSVDAEVSDLDAPENRFERGRGKLLEVYMPVQTTAGQPLLFEAYLTFSSVSASGRDLWRAFLPALLVALLLLYLVQLPLAWRLARRIRVAQEERERLLRSAIASSDLERRRIARDLHDGAVQNLAGVSYSLTAAARQLDGDGTAVVKESVRAAADETRRTIRELRSLLVDIYPPDLHREGLGPALADLVDRVAERGIEVRLDVPADLDLPPEVEALFFRSAQEALRNVLAHAQAGRVDVRVRARGGRAVIDVEDDGRGFDVAGHAEQGHLGLRLLGDLARDAGGRLEVHSEPGRGTCVRVEAPLS